MKRLDNRGIAMETAIVFMLVVFSLCALLTSLSFFGIYQSGTEKRTLLQDVELSQIGEDYLTSLREQTDLSESYENYEYEVWEHTLTVWKKNDVDRATVLFVEAELTAEGRIRILCWRYSAPTK